MTPEPAKSESPPRRRAWALLGSAVAVLIASLGVGWWVIGPRQAGDDSHPGPPADTALVSDAPAWFRDVTAGSGLDFTYRNGEEADQFTILESLGGGVALIDY